MRIDVTYQYLRRLYKPDPKIFVVTPERIENALTEKQRAFKANKLKAVDMHITPELNGCAEGAVRLSDLLYTTNRIY